MIEKAVIDRMEESKAILLVGEKECTVAWPRELLPQGAKEGDVLDIQLSVNREATREAREEAEVLLRQLLEQQEK
jgi:hypothetical protein